MHEACWQRPLSCITRASRLMLSCSASERDSCTPPMLFSSARPPSGRASSWHPSMRTTPATARSLRRALSERMGSRAATVQFGFVVSMLRYSAVVPLRRASFPLSGRPRHTRAPSKAPRHLAHLAPRLRGARGLHAGAAARSPHATQQLIVHHGLASIGAHQAGVRLLDESLLAGVRERAGEDLGWGLRGHAGRMLI